MKFVYCSSDYFVNNLEAYKVIDINTIEELIKLSKGQIIKIGQIDPMTVKCCKNFEEANYYYILIGE